MGVNDSWFRSKELNEDDNEKKDIVWRHPNVLCLSGRSFDVTAIVLACFFLIKRASFYPRSIHEWTIRVDDVLQETMEGKQRKKDSLHLLNISLITSLEIHILR